MPAFFLLLLDFHHSCFLSGFEATRLRPVLPDSCIYGGFMIQTRIARMGGFLGGGTELSGCGVACGVLG